MQFTLVYSADANETLNRLEIEDERKCEKVHKTLGLRQTNLKHQGLHTHKNDAYKGPNGEDIFETYVENNTPGAYRVFWYYGPERGTITIVAIIPHP